MHYTLHTKTQKEERRTKTLESANRTNLEDHADALGGQLDLGRVHQQRLHDLLRPHVRYRAVAHVDAAREVAQVVA